MAENAEAAATVDPYKFTQSCICRINSDSPVYGDMRDA